MTSETRSPSTSTVNQATASTSAAVVALACLLGACSHSEPASDEPAPEKDAPDAGAVSDPGASLDASERFPGGDTTNTLLFGSGAFSRLAENAMPEHEGPFFSGNSFFSSAWVEAPASTGARDGLGPLFNARSCAACHERDGRGRPPLEDDEVSGLLIRIGTGVLAESGAPAGDATYGDQLQPLGLPDVPGEGRVSVQYETSTGAYADGERYELSVPSYVLEDLEYGDPGTLRLSPRVAPAMIGLGLLEAIPERRLLELADPEDLDEDGISGKPNRVWDVRADATALGRFGWKAEQPNVEQQSAGAFLGDMGITSSLVPAQNCTASQAECLLATPGGEPEIDDELLGKVATYARLLAVPLRERFDDERVLEGREHFQELGCASCHVPRHETGDAELAELADQVIWPYTDLLLHDMGEALSDDRPSYLAEGSEWRTPPLWGVGRIVDVNGHDRLLHDGRARGVAEAILWHGGEAAAAKEHFVELDAGARQALVEFVESL